MQHLSPPVAYRGHYLHEGAGGKGKHQIEESYTDSDIDRFQRQWLVPPLEFGRYTAVTSASTVSIPFGTPKPVHGFQPGPALYPTPLTRLSPLRMGRHDKGLPYRIG